jgi:ubiquinol-cytochrome c reductase cytochrome b subunit
MTPDQMRFKVVSGGGNMPAYGKNLSPAEIEALVSFLETLHPANEPPAYDASRKAIERSQAVDGATTPANRNAAP